MRLFNKTMSEFKQEIENAYSTQRPKYCRKGQFVFNYINDVYGVKISPEASVNCFNNDDRIEDFVTYSFIELASITDDYISKTIKSWDKEHCRIYMLLCSRKKQDANPFIFQKVAERVAELLGASV